MYKKLITCLCLSIALCACHKKEILKGKRDSIVGVTYTEMDVNNDESHIELRTPVNSNELIELFDNHQHLSMNHSFSSHPKIKWHKRLGKKPIVSNILVFNDKLYMVNGNGELCCLEKQTGRLLWKTKVATQPNSGRFSGGISANKNIVYLATNMSEVIAFDTKTRKQLWKKNLDGMVKGVPVFANGKLIVNTSSNKTYALNASDGSVIWGYETSPAEIAGTVLGTPAVYKDSVICVYSNGDVVSLKLSDGSVNWSDVLIPNSIVQSGSTAVFHISASPIIIGDKVLVINSFSSMTMFDAQTGLRLWSRDFGTLLHPAIVDDNWMFVLAGNELLCVSLKTGVLKWKSKSLHEMLTKNKELKKYPWYGPLVVNNQLWIFGECASILKFDVSTGTYLGNIYIHHVRHRDAPVIVGNTMYATAYGKVYAIS